MAGATAAFGLVFLTLAGGSGPDPYAHLRAAHDRAGTSTAIAADRAALAAERVQAYDRAVLAAARADRDGAVVVGEEVLTSSKGKVLDETPRRRLFQVLATAAGARQTADLRLAVVAVGEAVAHVRAATQEWETEQARKEEPARRAKAAREAEKARRAAEAREADEARRVAEAWEAEEARRAEARTEEESRKSEQARRADGAGDGQGHDGKSGRQPSPQETREDDSRHAPAPVAVGTSSLRDRVAGIAAQHGCGSAAIRIDDPRLGGANGSADWYNNAILIRSSTPVERLPYVVAHECVHLMQYRVFGGNVDALAARMNSIYGGSGFSGLEQNADCVTRRWGLSAWHYTQSCSGARGAAAAAIAGGSKP